MSSKRIEPRVLKGFRDYLPKDATMRRALFSRISTIFDLHGFSPIETPALEYSEILLGKGSDETDKQMFRFKDQGDRDVSLRFDLTVPLARFVAEHQNALTFPFKRYHIGTVWRAEKPQKGRFREFTQCDFDIIGSKSSLADAEILLVATSFFKELGVPYTLRINHRAILSEILKHFKIEDKKTEALRAIDKLEKIGREGSLAELTREANMQSDQAEKLLTLLTDISNVTEHNEIFNLIANSIKQSDILDNAIISIKNVFKALSDSDIKSESLKFDITIARGLDYYTGIVFETQLKQLPSLGSVCSGGRYDDLASLYTSRDLPGVGGSVGIDRLLVGLEEIDALKSLVQEETRLLIANTNDSDSFKLLHLLRSNNIKAEIYPDDTKLGNQFKYAEKKGIEHVLVNGDAEKQNGTITLKNLQATSDEEKQISLKECDLIPFLIKNK